MHILTPSRSQPATIALSRLHNAKPSPTSQDHLILQPSTVSAAPEDHPEIKPCIEELLRTAYYPPELFVRIERVVEVPILYTRSYISDGAAGEEKPGTEREDVIRNNAERRARHRAFRLWVSDGEHVIQALLKKELHPFVSMGDVVPGAVLMLQTYKLRVADRVCKGPLSTGKDDAKIVFLAIEQYRTVWKPRTGFGAGDGIEAGEMVVKKRVRAGDKRGEARGSKRLRSERDDGLRDSADEPDVQVGDVPETGLSKAIQNNPTALGSEGSEPASTFLDIGAQLAAAAASDSEFTASGQIENSQHPWSQTATKAEFPESKSNYAETKPLLVPPVASPKKTAENHIQRRPAQTQPATRKQPPNTLKPATQRPPATHPIPPQFLHPPTFIMPSTVPRIPKLYTLSALLHPTEPIAKRNHVVSVLAIIVSISRTTRALPQTSLGLKRDMRIMDSTMPFRSSGILLSVFVDAANFFPEPGTVALFTGLKTHEYEGVSLNAYEKECGGKEWCVTDRGRLEEMGFDVTGLREWWGRRCEVVGCP